MLEKAFEDKLENLATFISPVHNVAGPFSFSNMTASETEGSSCRIGKSSDGHPYSGVTVVMDYSCHPHKDVNYMEGGSTSIVTVTKHGWAEEQVDEQLQCCYIAQVQSKGADVVSIGIALTHGSVEQHIMMYRIM